MLRSRCSSSLHRGWGIVRVARPLAVAALALVLCSSLLANTTGDDKRDPNDLIAESVRRLPGFMKPAKSRFNEATDPIVIGVLGETPIADKLKKQLKGLTVRKRPLVFRAIPFEPDQPLPKEAMLACHFLFLSKSCRSLEQEILQAVGSSVATFAHWPKFAERGGVLEFTTERDQTLGISINRKAAKRARFKIRADLLKLAQLVEEKIPTPPVRQQQETESEKTETSGGTP